MVFSGLALVLLVAVAPPEARKERGFDALGVPLLSFNSDVGVGYGAVGGAYFYSPGYRPYRYGLALQTFFTTRGIQNHWLRYDGPNLIGNTRVEARVEWRRELATPYFGPGNNAVPTFDDDPNDRRFSFERVAPAAWVRIRPNPFGETHPFKPYLGYGYRWNTIRPIADSLLSEDAPLGMGGGPTGQLLAGALWDTRDDENDTTRGGAEELSVRLAAVATGSRYTFAGLTASERRFWSLSPRAVLAQRLTVDYLFGQVPFFEWNNIGGVNYIEGIGGMGSVRGVTRNRYGGNLKAVSNTELRVNAFSVPLLGQEMKVGALAFVDFGRAWHPGIDGGPWYAWHPGVGGGVRVARRAAVLRFDYALATETGHPGLYITFGQMF